LPDLHTVRHLLCISFTSSLKSHFFSALTSYRENDCIITHAQNTTALPFHCPFNWNTSVTGHKEGYGLLASAQITAKVDWELLSQYYWLYIERRIAMKLARGGRETSRLRAECGLGVTPKKIERERDDYCDSLGEGGTKRLLL
jgi:hypothetical protein